MPTDINEQELREMAESKISKLLKYETEKLELYQRTPDIDMTEREKQIGRQDALDRLNSQIQSISTEGCRLLPKDSSVIGIKDHLGNNNIYLNTVYQHVLNIRDHPRSHNFSRASSKNSEIGKIESMNEVADYIEGISKKIMHNT